MELRDVRGLVEFQADVDVVGHALLEFGDRGLDGVDDRERGCVGALGDGDVDGALAVDVRIGGDDVGAVFDGADVAQIDGGSRHGPDRRAQQFGEIAAERGVGSGDAHRFAGPHIARGHHERALLTAAMASSGEMLILLQLVGIERDDDGALVAAERGRRGNAGQRREQRAHAVQREVLHLALSCGSLLKTSWPTATLPASKRVMKGGTVPGGMKARARFT